MQAAKPFSTAAASQKYSLVRKSKRGRSVTRGIRSKNPRPYIPTLEVDDYLLHFLSLQIDQGQDDGGGTHLALVTETGPKKRRRKRVRNSNRRKMSPVRKRRRKTRRKKKKNSSSEAGVANSYLPVIVLNSNPVVTEEKKSRCSTGCMERPDHGPTFVLR